VPKQSELLDRIQGAEDDLNEMSALMSKYQEQGKQSEFEELDSAYQQAYPDYRKLVEQLGELRNRIEQMSVHVQRIEDCVRDTGMFPGL
jgi:archaellum component FlaC